MAKPKGHKEAFSRFFEEPTRETLHSLLAENVGETKYLDFKARWPDHSLLAKHIIGFANVGNGCVVVGVEENEESGLTSVGLEKVKDKADILGGIRKYIPTELSECIEIIDFKFEGPGYEKLINKYFQVLIIEFKQDRIPFVAVCDGRDIRSGAIYVRREGSVGEANYSEIQNIINKRLETGHLTPQEIDLKNDIEQLRVLYKEIPKSQLVFRHIFDNSLYESNFDIKPTPEAPKESVEEFISLLIDAKKQDIASKLGVIKFVAALRKIGNLSYHSQDV